MGTHSTRRDTSPCGDVQEAICDSWPDGIVEMLLAIRLGNVSSNVTRSYQVLMRMFIVEGFKRLKRAR